MIEKAFGSAYYCESLLHSADQRTYQTSAQRQQSPVRLGLPPTGAPSQQTHLHEANHSNPSHKLDQITPTWAARSTRILAKDVSLKTCSYFSLGTSTSPLPCPLSHSYNALRWSQVMTLPLH